MKTNVLLLMSFLFFSFVSCQKSDQLLEQEIINDSEIQELFEVLYETGINTSEIEIDRNRERFIIEGDIVIPFYYLCKSTLKSASQYHYKNPYYVGLTNITNIEVYIDSNVPSSWSNAVIAAISEWNNISNFSRINFSTTTNIGNAEIIVRAFYSIIGVVAMAPWPYNSIPGDYVEINTYYNYFSDSYKKEVITHELGHTIGFVHTNGATNNTSGSEHIPGTPTIEELNSVMYRYVHSWGDGFTTNDISAAIFCYPSQQVDVLCSVCASIYDNTVIPFAFQPSSYICPNCGASKLDFELDY